MFIVHWGGAVHLGVILIVRIRDGKGICVVGMGDNIAGKLDPRLFTVEPFGRIGIVNPLRSEKIVVITI